jgi:hypothetical protein
VSHACHAPSCKRQVPPHMFACRPHWLALPQKMRRAIWREYRPGQELDKRPSRRYLAVQQLACAHLVFKAHDDEAVLATLPYISEAMRYAKESIVDGLGDPLEDLIPKEWPVLHAEGASHG